MDDNKKQNNSAPEIDNELIESIAEQVHIAWENQRINTGWRYGEEYNKEKKLHPCLVPYSELPDSEREVDRATTRKVLEALKMLGYVITKNNY